MKNNRRFFILLKSVLLTVVMALVLPSSSVSSASTLYLPGDSFYPTLAAPEYLTETYGSCYYDSSGVGATVCGPVWRRGFRINGSGFTYAIWTDTHRLGHLQVWVDGVLEDSLTFNYYGWQTATVSGLTPGVHEVLLRVDGTACADPSDTDNCADPSNPNSYFFNELTVTGPGDLDPPTNPASAAETHGAVDGVWQNTINMPEFTWPAGTDALSGAAGYEVYFGADPNGTSTDFQVGTTYTTTAPYADGTYYLRLRTKDNADNYAPWVTLFTFNVDTTPPVIVLSRSGTAGAGGWWTSPLDLSAVITDAGSGVASFNRVIDGGAPQPVSDQTFAMDGTHTVVYFAVDNAGNPATVTENVWIDQTLPVPQLDATGTMGENGWYVSAVGLQANGTDAASGLAAAELEVGGSGVWMNAITLNTSGTYPVAYRAADVAGLTATDGPDT
ncbi:MAG: HYR domain-containing protein, partial [Anaerolineaceae bacterium]|nr:HYR domain-containing protein [Anaerolineaceae bacterium]